ncbi:hypothetical protein TCAL_10334 [Tigriopus californicus]|uniref:snRNA-activating protein complex subunit 3 n=1 Tax=Tigriopus californicus TaxID=6832 RepID=A0A553NCT5_TIGCA|nr:uncharacterized protein LOC131889698 [Tigriopus californicus]TRY63218.1 hypothetical protein TCAL_10334 [Tigriopus californicus]
MDLVHRPDQRSSWISSDRVLLRDYFADFRDRLSRHRPPSGLKGDLRVISNDKLIQWINYSPNAGNQDDPEQTLDSDTFRDLVQNCHEDALSVPGEMPPVRHHLPTNKVDEDGCTRFKMMPIPEMGPSLLETLAHGADFRANASKYEKYRHQRQLRHQNSNWLDATPFVPPNRLASKATETDIVVIVRVYKSFKSTNLNPKFTVNNLKYSQEIMMLGTNKLSELRDFIRCHADHFITQDVSDNPQDAQTSQKKSKDIYKSGFFYIEGCFYNDHRWPECEDLSETVRQWAENGNRGLGPFATAKMEETAIEDLEIRFGYPYVYVHQGHHEHLFSFNDARLMAWDDPQYAPSYPFERSQGTLRSKYCMICSLNVAKWVTQDNIRVPEDPFFFCEECFHSFNYDSAGKKIGQFKAFPFIDVNVV